MEVSTGPVAEAIARGDPVEVCETLYSIPGLALYTRFTYDVTLSDALISQVLIPQVLPWAIATFSLALLLLVCVVSWEILKHACHQRCCFHHPPRQKSEREVFSRPSFKRLTVLIFLAGLAMIALATFVVVAIQKHRLDKLPDYVEAVKGNVTGLLSVGDALVTSGLEVIAYLDENLMLDEAYSNLTCIDNALSGIPTDTNETLGVLLPMLSSLLPQAALFLDHVELLQDWYLPTMRESNELLQGSGDWRKDLQDQTADAIAALNSGDRASREAALDTLSLSAKATEAEEFVAALDAMDALRESQLLQVLAEDIAVLTPYASRVKPYLSPAIDDLEVMVTLVKQARPCIQSLADILVHINNTVMILPPDVQEVLDTVEDTLGYMDLFQEAVSDLQEAESGVTIVLRVLGAMEPFVDLLPSLTQALNLPSAGAPRSFYEELSQVMSDADRALADGNVNPTDELNDVRKSSRPGLLKGIELSAYFLALNGAAATGRLAEGQLPTEQIAALQDFVVSLPTGEIDRLEGAMASLKSATDTVLNLDEGVAKLRGHIVTAQEMIVAADTALKELNATLIAADGYLEQIPYAFNPKEISNTVQKVTQTVYTVDDVVNITMACLGAISIGLIVGVLVSMVVHVPWVLAVLACAMAFMVLLTFVIAMAHGGAAVVSSSGCISFEGFMYDFVAEHGNTSEVAFALLDTYLYGADSSLITKYLVDQAGVNTTEVAQELEEALEALEELQIQVQNSEVVLQEPLNTMLLVDVKGDLVAIHTIVLDLLYLTSFDIVHNLYVTAKSTICCDLVRNLSQKWTALLVGGFLMAMSDVLLVLYIRMTDELNPEGRFCQCKVYYPLTPSRWRGEEGEKQKKTQAETQLAEHVHPMAIVAAGPGKTETSGALGGAPSPASMTELSVGLAGIQLVEPGPSWGGAHSTSADASKAGAQLVQLTFPAAIIAPDAEETMSSGARGGAPPPASMTGTSVGLAGIQCAEHPPIWGGAPIIRVAEHPVAEAEAARAQDGLQPAEVEDAAGRQLQGQGEKLEDGGDVTSGRGGSGHGIPAGSVDPLAMPPPQPHEQT